MVQMKSKASIGTQIQFKEDDMLTLLSIFCLNPMWTWTLALCIEYKEK